MSLLTIVVLVTTKSHDNNARLSEIINYNLLQHKIMYNIID